MVALLLLSCARAVEVDRVSVRADGVEGHYEGPEFLSPPEMLWRGVRKSDYAHQLSNRVARVVGDELKARAAAGNPSRVDLDGIRMTTEGMNGSGDVQVTLWVPLVAAETPTQTRTHFDHRGGWGHASEVVDGWTASLRTKYGATVACTPVLRTPEGLEETWCAW